jgi:hypothetical protein
VGNALVIVERAGPLVELAATLELAADFARASKAKTTLAAYRSDWRVFEGWCQERGLAWLAAKAPRSENFATAPSCCWGSLAHFDDPSSLPLT